MKVGHIGINVTNIEVSKEFYKNLFDFDIIFESNEENKKYAFLGNNGELLITLWEQANTMFSNSTAGLHHLAFVLKDIEELILFEKKIKKLNVTKIYDTIVSHSESSKSGGIFFYDPDNTRLEIYVKSGIHECKPATDGAPSCGFF
jgi:lactoylglutathione lyase